METITAAALFLLAFAFLFGFGYFGWTSVKEGERRAAGIGFALALLGFALFGLAALLPPGGRMAVIAAALVLALLLAFLFYLPLGRVQPGDDTPARRYDERDIMFARARLQPGSTNYEAYYAMRPENKAVDDRTRSRPGLLSFDAKLANPFQFAPVIGSFDLTGALREAVDGPVAEGRQELSAQKMSAYVKGLAAFYGALEVGITELKPYHVYSHIGRGSGEYGAPVRLDHRYVIAFSVEMAHAMVGSSPYPPTSMETGKQYVEAARVAVQLAAALRALGYPARAHIDGNYRVIAPLVGRDAGLGEIGRMGLLMTPRQGPRIRLGVVTTQAELIPDRRNPDPSVIDFCNVCKKCAENCPSRSIPFDERKEIDGALRWRIKSETCFDYWNVTGTDCARCMAVCPYSHPDSAVHNLVRWGIASSGAFRRAAVWLDDAFYGREPSRRPAPEWARLP